MSVMLTCGFYYFLVARYFKFHNLIFNTVNIDRYNFRNRSYLGSLHNFQDLASGKGCEATKFENY